MWVTMVWKEQSDTQMQVPALKILPVFQTATEHGACIFHIYLGYQKLKVFSHAMILSALKNLKGSYWSMEMFMVSFSPVAGYGEDNTGMQGSAFLPAQCMLPAPGDWVVTCCLPLSLLSFLSYAKGSENLYQVVSSEQAIFPFFRKGLGHQKLCCSQMKNLPGRDWLASRWNSRTKLSEDIF